jgi:hypothetical protein
MPKPKIKREKGLERPLSAIPSKHGGTIATLLAPSLCCHSSDDDDAEPLLSRRSLQLKLLNTPLHPQAKSLTRIKTERLLTKSDHVIAALPAPATHHEVLPPNVQMGGVGVASGRLGTRPPPVASWLSSRPISALATPQQTVVPTKTYPHHQLLTGNSLTRSHRVFSNRYAPHKYIRHITRTTRMEGFDFGDDSATGTGGDMDFNALGAYTGAQSMSCIIICSGRRLQWRCQR